MPLNGTSLTSQAPDGAPTQNISQPSSMAAAGTMNIQARKEPLTEIQLTQIASKLLLKMPVISSIKRTITGTKNVESEFGTYEIDNAIVGHEEEIEVKVFLRDGLTRELIEAGLRTSPPAATINHLQRLAMHKRLGSSDRDRTVLLHDYAEALRPYSDFIVYIACKLFWENDADAFFPKIKPLREVCENLHQLFNRLLDAPNLPNALAPPKPDRKNYYSDPYPHPMRRQICDFLKSKGEQDYFRSALYSNYELEQMAAKYGWQRP